MQKDSTRLLSQFSSNYNSNYRRIPFFRITEENRKPSTHWMGWFSSPPSSCSYAGTLLFARTERRVITRVFTRTHAHTQAHIRANVWNARLRAASSAVILTTLQPLCRPHACKPRMKSVRRSEWEKRAGFTPRCPWRRLPPTTFLYFSPYTSASCFIPKNSIVLRFPPSSPRPSRGRAEPVPPPRRDVSSVEARPSRRRSHPRFVPRCASRYVAIRYTGLSVDLVSPRRSRLREESNHPRGDQRALLPLGIGLRIPAWRTIPLRVRLEHRFDSSSTLEGATGDSFVIGVTTREAISRGRCLCTLFLWQGSIIQKRNSVNFK